MALCVCTAVACSEKVWIEDLVEMEKDKVRGRYDLESAVWEGESIDLNGDGVFTNDYYAEYGVQEDEFQGTFSDQVSIGVPVMSVWGHDEWRRVVKGSEYVKFRYDVSINGSKSSLNFRINDDITDFTLIENGKVSFRKEITVYTGSGTDITDATATVLFTYKRIKYYR